MAVAALVSAIVLGGCQDWEFDAPTAPLSDQIDGRITSPTGSGATRTGEPLFFCFTSVLKTGGPWKYRYGILPLAFGRREFEAAGQRYGLLQYRRYAADGTLTRVANCRIPYSQLAVHVMNARFSNRGAAEARLNEVAASASGQDAFLLFTMASDDLECGMYGNPCPIDPIDVDCSENPAECGADGPGDIGDGWGDCDPLFQDCYGEGGDDGGYGGDDPCLECGGGGSGGGSSDDGTAPGGESWSSICNPDWDPECVLRKKEDMTAQEIAELEAMVDMLRKHACGQHADLLRLYLDRNRVALWDARILRYGDLLHGRVDPATGDIYIWTGKNKLPEDIVNVERTMAHELTHVLFPSYSETQVRDIAKRCSGGA